MKRLKPSTALKIGLKKHKRADGAFYRDGATCALGAIGVGLGVKGSEALNSMEFNFDSKVAPYCPRLNDTVKYPDSIIKELELDEEYDETENRLQDIIVELNDDHKWNRGRIARWLKKIGY